MPKILVHVTYVPEHQTRAQIDFIMSKSEIDKCHSVSTYLSLNSVH